MDLVANLYVIFIFVVIILLFIYIGPISALKMLNYDCFVQSANIHRNLVNQFTFSNFFCLAGVAPPANYNFRCSAPPES